MYLAAAKHKPKEEPEEDADAQGDPDFPDENGERRFDSDSDSD